MKIALCIICKPTDAEAEDLGRCLKYINHQVDGIFVTLAGSKKQLKNKRVRDIAKLYGAEVSEFEWVHDFSKARNFNFAQVPKDYDYIMWLDTDDVVRGAEKLRQTIEDNPRVDAFSLWYLYAFDEHKNPVVVHHKTRILRNDGSTKWVGDLHEDFAPNRQLTTKHVEGIEVLHLTSDERREENKHRNVEISKKQVSRLPDDPRSFWNLANSLKGAGQNEKAVDMFKKFMKMSESEDEKYIARLRMAESLWILNKKNEAIEQAQAAIGLKPDYPDAYHLTGSLYFEMERYEDSIKMFLNGLIKKPPIYSIIVYNPRDYDYSPMMNLAKAYFRISRPDMALPLLEGCLKVVPQDKRLKGLIKDIKKEVKKFDGAVKAIQRLQKIKDDKKLWTELEKLPDDIKSHPGVCMLRNSRFVKAESSGKDLVFYCGLTTHEWSPQIAELVGVGGSEEAIIHLSKRLVKRGWNVTVYCNCGWKEFESDGVQYKPFWMWNPRDKQDVTVLWRSPRAADYEINTKKLYIDVHDVIQEGEFNEKRLDKIDGIFVKSNFHRQCFPNVPDNKFVIVPNGIESDKFKVDTKRDPNLLINTSSADRSLSGLLDLFPDVRKEVKDAELKWAYGWGVYDTVHGDNLRAMNWKDSIVKKMDQPGFEDLGRISHPEVQELYLKANVFAYPSDFAEIDCISLTKAMAAGAIPVTTDFSAMGEKAGHGGVFIKSDKNHSNWTEREFDRSMETNTHKWTKSVIELLKNPPSEEERQAMRKWAQDTYDWEIITDKWHKNISS